MISFLLCLALLIVGYFVYGKIVDNTFGPDDRETPAVRINDGVDYVVMPQWKLFLVQLLNIAGLGPIFGAMQGALWGPVVFLWITFGTIFAGGVHDYFSGMMSERNDGASIAEITGKYLGPVMQNVMRVFSVVLLIMVGTVFAVGPAGLIVELCSQSGASGVFTSLLFWLILILVYYFIATFISIDAVIGKIYPIFGICLIIMAIGVIFGIFTNPAYTIPEIWDHFGSMHPSGTPIWSFMFITVACGAISGFHSTQSPLMARCMKSEKQGHFVFYGAMVCEGIIALIWAAAGCSLYEVTGGLNTGLAAALAEGQSAAIYDVCSKTMGGIGIALAMIGVVICPITSGDTAFRSARLTLADWLKLDQDSYANRLKLCIPVLGVGAFLGIGNALMQTSLNPLLSNIVSGERLASSLTFGQFVKAIASFLAPYIAMWGATQAIPSLGMGWRVLFPVYMVIAVIAILWLSGTSIREEKEEGRPSTFGECLALLGKPFIFLCFLGIMCHVGIDLGTNTTAPKIQMERLGMTLADARYPNTHYLIFRTAGCFLGAFILQKMAPRTFFGISVLCMLAAMVGLFVFHEKAMIYICIALIGFGNSNIFPVIFSQALLAMPQKKNEVSGLMIMGLFGGTVFPIAMGLASDAVGQSGAVAVMTVGVVYLFFYMLRMKR